MSFHGLIAHFFVALNNIPLPRYITVYPLKDIHLLKDILIASKLWQLWIKLLQTSVCRYFCGHKFLTPVGKYQGVHLLDCMVMVCLVFQETAKVSSSMAIPFCISTSNEWEFLLLYVLRSIWCCQCSRFWPF